VIQADSYARCVEILNENEDLLLSDNYFDMNAGNRRLKILRGNPDNISLRSVYDIGKN
jgi:beta-mannosidase